MFDKDGYPTDEALMLVEMYNIAEDGLEGFIDLVENLWNDCGISRRGHKYWRLITGGWSGNEDVIYAMKQNTMFWLCYWYSSKRGGLYVFDMKAIKRSKKKVR
jgi:hypothetical protein